MYHRNAEVLSEGCDGKVDHTEFVLIPEGSFTLAGQIDPRFCEISELAEIIIEFPLPYARAHRHHDGVAGLLKSLRKGEVPVTYGAIAVYLAVCDLKITGAVKRVVRLGDSLLKGHRRSEYLECRTGHIRIGEHLVRPHLCLKILFQRVIFGTAYGVARHIEQSLIIIIERARIVAVKVGICRHREHRSRFDVHDKPRRPAFGLAFLECRLELLAQDHLKLYVKRRFNVVSVHGVDNALVFKGHFPAVGIARSDVFAGRARKLAVILVFKPVKSGSVRPGKAYDVRSNISVRVIALARRLDEHHVLKLVLRNEIKHEIGTFAVGKADNRCVKAPFFLFDHIGNVVIRHAVFFAEDIREPARDNIVVVLCVRSR